MTRIHLDSKEFLLPLLIECLIETSFNFLQSSSILSLSQIDVLFSALALEEANTKMDHYSALNVFYVVDFCRYVLIVSRALMN